MVSTFINPVLNPSVNLGMQQFDDESPLRLYPNSSEQDIDLVIQAVYRQVLGNIHVMESERLTSAESRLRHGELTVREFVREVAKSSLYRDRFVDSCTRSRTIELNFKHLLGRAPTSYDEIVEQGHIYDSGGYEAEIDSYLDGAEYQSAFGDDVVPYARGYKTQSSQTLAGFTHWFALLRSTSSSDKTQSPQNRPRLNSALMNNSASLVHPLRRLAPQTRVVASAPTPSPSASTPGVSAPAADYQDRFYQAYEPFKTADPVEYVPGASDSDFDVVIRALYRQVLGNAHVMESERLTVHESQLRSGSISVREFVRRLAKSDLYRSRFFDCCYSYRGVELNYKHLLGRAPDNFNETRFHTSILDTQGYEADIDSYIDSEEYQAAFGEWIVPYYRGYQTQSGQSMLEFTNMLELVKSASTSDYDAIADQKPIAMESIMESASKGQRSAPADPVALIQAALRSAPAVKPSPWEMLTFDSPTVDTALQEKSEQQVSEIAQLQQELAQVQRLASMGESFTGHLKYNRVTGTSDAASADTTLSLEQRVDAQSQQIESLRQQINQARSLALVGEACLNRWRTRIFS